MQRNLSSIGLFKRCQAQMQLNEEGLYDWVGIKLDFSNHQSKGKTVHPTVSCTQLDRKGNITTWIT